MAEKSETKYVLEKDTIIKINPFRKGIIIMTMSERLAFNQENARKTAERLRRMESDQYYMPETKAPVVERPRRRLPEVSQETITGNNTYQVNDRTKEFYNRMAKEYPNTFKVISSNVVAMPLEMVNFISYEY